MDDAPAWTRGYRLEGGLRKMPEAPLAAGKRPITLLWILIGLLIAGACTMKSELGGADGGHGGQDATSRADSDPAALKALLTVGSSEAVPLRDLAAVEAGAAQSIDTDSPLWPLASYLLGETQLRLGARETARATFRGLAEWAASDPYGDGWGGSSLATAGLWRWAQLLNELPRLPTGEAEQLLAASETLLDSRFTRELFSTPVLTSLPQLEEDIARNVAYAALRSGQEGESAQQAFLRYLSTATDQDLGTQGEQIAERVVRAGLASRGRLRLLRAKRMFAVDLHDAAREVLAELSTSDDSHNRTEALLYLARLERRRSAGAEREAKIELLNRALADAKNPDLAQTILYERALVKNREGPGRDVEGFLWDLKGLIDEFPRGRLADEALYELARHYQYHDQHEEAEEYFERTRSFPEPNDRVNLSHIQPAMALIARGEPAELERAAEVLVALDRRQPVGPFYLGSLFWRGRIAEDLGRADEAAGLFSQVIEESPYDYYAVRSRLHLRLGPEARGRLWLDEESRDEIRSRYAESEVPSSLSANTPYHERLRWAVGSGTYQTVLAVQGRLRQRFRAQRPEDLSLEELEEADLLTHLLVLLALRQDAQAAKSTTPTPENRLELAALVGHRAGDWSLAVALVQGAGEQLALRAMKAQRDSRYLATAYMVVYRGAITRSSVENGLPPELLYAVARAESLFDSRALSPDGALGLFQFTANTFDGLDERWSLLASNGVASREEYLLDPERNVALAGRWFREELLGRWDDEIFPALLAHNAGPAAVRSWRQQWEEWGKQGDLEYQVETIRYLETRLFARAVLRDMAITQAGAILESE